MGDNNSVVIVRKPIQNPFALKVGQVFTGFGVGCGLGIGVGRPINLGAIPVLNQVMSATRGATDAFSGIGRHVNHSLKVVGAKNIEAGIGCGIGFGHGFGVGLAIKPGVVNQIQSCVVQAAMNMMVKFGMVPNLSAAQNILPSSIQNSKTIISDTDGENPIGSMLQFGTKAVDSTSQDGNFSKASRHDTSSKNTPMLNTSYGSRTEKVISSFLQTSLVENEEREAKNSTNESLQSVNHMMRLVLKHQVTIEELREENAKLRQILVEDFKLSPEKFKGKHSSTDRYSCTECFECRRKQRRKR